MLYYWVLALGPWPLVSDHSGPRPTLTRRKHPPPPPRPHFFFFSGAVASPVALSAASPTGCALVCGLVCAEFFPWPCAIPVGLLPPYFRPEIPTGTGGDRIPAGIPAGSLWAPLGPPRPPLGPLQRHKLHHFFWLQLSHSVLRFSLGMDIQFVLGNGNETRRTGNCHCNCHCNDHYYTTLYYTIL